MLRLDYLSVITVKCVGDARYSSTSPKKKIFLYSLVFLIPINADCLLKVKLISSLNEDFFPVIMKRRKPDISLKIY